MATADKAHGTKCVRIGLNIVTSQNALIFNKTLWVLPPVNNFFKWATGIMHAELTKRAKVNVKIMYVKLSPCKALEGNRWYERPALRPDHFTLEEVNASTHRTGAGVHLESRSGRLKEHRNILPVTRFEPRSMEYYKMSSHVRNICNSESTEYCGSHCPYLKR
jgi:hypothetical protein